MKASELRKLIREEVARVIKEERQDDQIRLKLINPKKDFKNALALLKTAGLFVYDSSIDQSQQNASIYVPTDDESKAISILKSKGITAVAIKFGVSEASTNTFPVDIKLAKAVNMDIDELQDQCDMEYGLANYSQDRDYRWIIARGDDFPNGIEILNKKMLKDAGIMDMLDFLNQL